MAIIRHLLFVGCFLGFAWCIAEFVVYHHHAAIGGAHNAVGTQGGGGLISCGWNKNRALVVHAVFRRKPWRGGCIGHESAQECAGALYVPILFVGATQYFALDSVANGFIHIAGISNFAHDAVHTIADVLIFRYQLVHLDSQSVVDGVYGIGWHLQRIGFRFFRCVFLFWTIW